MATNSKSFSMEKTETTREILPDGTIKIKTVTQKTFRDGRVVTEETTKTEKPTQDGARTLELVEAPPASRQRKSSPFKLPKFFQSIGKTKENPNIPQQHSNSKFLPVDEFRRELLHFHNEKRAQHGAPNLVINEKLNCIAQEWAEHLAKINSLQHRPKSQYGENVFMGFDSKGPILPSQVGENWYSEVKKYNYAQPSSSCGHFTQMVWKGSKEVGFGCAITKDGSTYVVANYDPPGNVMGTFKENVQPSE